MQILIIIAVITASYLLGSINSAIITSKLLHNTDIRKHGSGNAGATNALRTMGKTAAFIVLLGDMLKGALAVLIGRLLSDAAGMQGEQYLELAAGLSAVLGHNFPIFFGFKGGKGILTSAAVILFVDWRAGLACIAVGIIIIVVTRFVSLGSMVGSAVFPIIMLHLNQTKDGKYILFGFSLVFAILAVVMHHANIKRLLAGNESKIGDKKDKIK